MTRQYDIIDGHRLEVGPSWHQRTPEERAALCNGVGSGDQPTMLTYVLGALPYLLPASKPHDVGYARGGTERDRLADDRRFRRNAYRVARDEIGSFWSRLFRSTRRAE